MNNATARSLPAAPVVEIERVFREHASRMLAAAYRVTGNAQDAEDVLQTVFLRLIRRSSGVELTDDPSPYLQRAAVNAGLDVLRSRGAARATPLEEVETVLADPARTNPEQARRGAEIRERIREALGELSPRSAETFALRYFEGYDNQEIARMTRSTPGTVAVVLHRTRQRLREAIRPFLQGDEP